MVRVGPDVVAVAGGRARETDGRHGVEQPKHAHAARHAEEPPTPEHEVAQPGGEDAGLSGD